jgi:hypothetical protein
MVIRSRKSSSALFRTRTSTPTPACDAAPPVPPIPANIPEKPHVTRSLKYLTDDAQRKRALQVAEEWRMNFASDKWSNVLGEVKNAKKGILPPEVSTVKKPHRTRIYRSETDDSRRRAESWGGPGEAPRPLCWPGQDDEEEDQKEETSEVLFLRPWPRPQARDNAFAQKGFWGDGESESTHAPRRRLFRRTSFALSPPASGSLMRSFDSNRPKDTEARLAYDLITSSVAPSDSTNILDRHRVDSSTILHDLPETLAYFVNKENDTMKEYTIWEPFERIALIPRHPERDGEAVHCVNELKERQKMLRMMRPLKESILDISKEELRAAWAVCIAERMEREKKEKKEKEKREKKEKEEKEEEKGIEVEDNDGYEYCNFLRNIQREGSAAYPVSEKLWSGTQSADSRSIPASTTNSYSSKSRSRSLRNDSASISPQSGGLAVATPRSSTSTTANSSLPQSLYRSQTYDAPPIPSIPTSQRSNTPSISSHDTSIATVANSSSSISSRCSLPETVINIGKSSDALKHSKRVIRPPLAILTKHSSKAGKSEASPAQKEERRRGPNMNDLITWAEELKGFREEGSVSSSESTGTVIRDGTTEKVRERTDVVNEVRDENAIQFIPLPPPSAVFPSSYWPNSEGSPAVGSAFQSSSPSKSGDRCLTTQDYFGAAVAIPAAQARDVRQSGGGKAGHPDDNIRREEDARKKEKDAAEREWADEMQRMQDREFARQARERENQSRGF